MAYSIRQNPSPFFTAGRPYGILGFVIHHAATTSFDGIGATFKTRGVSAGYGVGLNNNVDQYVADNNWAYHAGNREANKKYIGIEHVNTSGSPEWNISENTFTTSTELTADLARRHGIKKLIPFVNLFPHDHFSATACPAKLKARMQEYADRVNALLGGGSVNPAPTPTIPAKRSNEEIAREVANGKWGNNPARATNLRNAGYDPNVIQGIVNSFYNKTTAPKISVADLARQVIAGSWGVNPARVENLKRAGHDPVAVQAEVNRQLGVGKTVSAGGIIAVGQTVRFKTPYDYKGTKLGVSGNYTVMEVRGDRAVVGRGGAVTAAAKTTNLQRV